MQPNLKNMQYDFTGYIRNPEQGKIPAGIDPKRMQVYTECVFNNLDNTLTAGYPVLQQLLSTQCWHQLIREFLISYRAQKPYFHQIPEEFLTFLQMRGIGAEEPPFLIELAHYEWVELALSIAEDPPPDTWVVKQGDLLTHSVVLSPLAWAFQYHYPVHRIGPNFQPKKTAEQSTYLMIYRDRTNTVNFMEINAVTARLLDYIHQQPQLTSIEMLENIAKELHHPHPQQVIEGGHAIVKQLYEYGIILGIR